MNALPTVNSDNFRLTTGNYSRGFVLKTLYEERNSQWVHAATTQEGPMRKILLSLAAVSAIVSAATLAPMR